MRDNRRGLKKTAAALDNFSSKLSVDKALRIPGERLPRHRNTWTGASPGADVQPHGRALTDRCLPRLKEFISGYSPSGPLEAWRNGVLCLRVRSIGEAAGLRVAAHGVGFERIPECTAASPIDLNAPDHVEVADGWIDCPPDEGAP
jgi:hypothetical protein